MSVDVGYFFNSEKSFEQLCEEMNEYLDFNFQPNGEDKTHAFTRFLGMGFDFYIHSFESDGELNFEDYKYYLGVTARPYAKDMRLSVLAFTASILYRQLKISDGMLESNMGIILARYEERLISEEAKDLFDKISNKFVEYPQHLIDLDELAWQ
jgi:hypothetical protein